MSTRPRSNEGQRHPTWELVEILELQKYRFSDMDTSSDPMYFGYIDPDGLWYIAELNEASGTMRYVKGAGSYATAWTNRAIQSYGYYDAVF